MKDLYAQATARASEPAPRKRIATRIGDARSDALKVPLALTLAAGSTMVMEIIREPVTA